MFMVVARWQESSECRECLYFIMMIFDTLDNWISEKLGVDAKKNVWVHAVATIAFDFGSVEIQGIKIID
jgi:hypothetical protein